MASVTLLSAQAQLFSPEALNGAMFGSLMGGLIGGSGNNGCGYNYYGCGNGFSGQGAAIGAGVGLLAGALVGQARRDEYYSGETYAYSPAPTVSLGYGYVSPVSSAYVYYSPNAYTAPGYYYRPTRPNYAVSGTLLGAASGALIGQGADCKPGQGAAIGAAAGLVLGSIAEFSAKKQEQKIVAAQTTAQPVVTTVTQDPRPQTQDASAQITSQPVANSTYHWTPRPQIADAPTVPDAPTF
jgi:uncharacterized protein YcfJ